MHILNSKACQLIEHQELLDLQRAILLKQLTRMQKIDK